MKDKSRTLGFVFQATGGLQMPCESGREVMEREPSEGLGQFFEEDRLTREVAREAGRSVGTMIQTWEMSTCVQVEVWIWEGTFRERMAVLG